MTIITISGCINEISEAPGCNHSPFLGGCFGTHIVKNLTVEPEISCLKFELTNCNDEGISVLNYCEEPVTIGGMKLEERRINERGTVIPSRTMIDEERTPSGEIVVSNVSKPYKPDFDDLITINGTVGNNTVKISYIKTKSLC